MKEFLKYIQSSFDTHSKGASARKISAFVLTATVVIICLVWLYSCFKKGEYPMMESILTLLLATATGLLGMTSYSANKTIKKDDENNNNDTNSDTPTQ